MRIQVKLVGIQAVVSTPLKNMSSSVGIILSNWMESHNPVTTNQLWLQTS